MLVHSELIDEYFKCLRAQLWTTGMNWYLWNQNNNTVKLNTKAFMLTFVLSTLFTACRALDIILESKNSSNDPSGILMHIRTIFMIVPLTISVFSFEMGRHGNAVEQLFMGLASFEQRYCPQGQGRYCSTLPYI